MMTCPPCLVVAVLVVASANVAFAGGVDDPKFSPCSEGLRPQIACAAERRVSSPAELDDTLRSGFVGCVIVPRDASFDMTGKASLPIGTGVSLLGERGYLCSRPILYTTDRDTDFALFDIIGNDSTVRGIHFRGPADGDRDKEQRWSSALAIHQDAERLLGRNIVVEDCELDEWTYAGVAVASWPHARTPEEFDPKWPRLSSRDAGLVLITHNYIHHNVRNGLGYGVVIDSAAYATILGNVFDFNRHAIASNGFAHTGYIARHNYVLEGGYTEDSVWNQHFDVHGSNEGGYGGPAGEYYEIANNAFRGDQDYYVVKNRSAFMLRGAPTQGAHFNANVCTHGSLDSAVSLKNSSGDTGWSEDHEEFNFHAAGNEFSEHRDNDIGIGDFDGDGRDDIFIATGAAWFFSPAGVEPWIFLHASDKDRDELGIVDIDNDGITDVLYRDSVGNIGWLKSGRIALAPLTTSSVAMKDVRFGDFDGDGSNDIFTTHNDQWTIWYGATRTWTWVQSSSLSVEEFLFGEFDDVPGTDVLAVVEDAWSISSAATGYWSHHNDQWSRDFRASVAADFDGDGRTDVAYNDTVDFDDYTHLWFVSYSGREKPVVLRDGTDIPTYFPISFPRLRELFIGHFDGDARAEVITYAGHSAPDGLSDYHNHFGVWRADGPGQPFAPLSRMPMR